MIKKYVIVLGVLVILAALYLALQKPPSVISERANRSSPPVVAEVPKYQELVAEKYIAGYASVLASPGLISEIVTSVSGELIAKTDFVSHNPKWLPGLPEPFFLNSEKKIEDLRISSETEAYTCGDGPDGNATTPDVRISTKEYTNLIRQYLAESKSYAEKGYAGYSLKPEKTAYLITSSSLVLAFFDQCLP